VPLPATRTGPGLTAEGSAGQPVAEELAGLDDDEEAAGVSRRMVVNLEQGAANPSVGTLLKISDALGVDLPALVEPPRRTRR
jgi:hypothetical protein